ncbi:unnamed protein product [Rhizoctonia solani]|uniref:tyrosinase n=1 Tax=Rhizoctonia solani TaxID=456999 RepID=A0A8H2ZZ57_9AGAM|nr:unnamed protein product [Rhizoctonia solani]
MASNNPYLITGAGTDVQPRLEIRKLILKDKQFALFVLAWNEIRKPDYKPPAARYGEQAGIHGMPYKTWLGDPAGQPKAGDRTFTGYCNHMSIHFPTWHRPAIMLLEQSIWEAATRQAQQYAKDNPTEASEWLDAANKLRFPYWDWTDPGDDSKFPKIFRDPRVKIRVPKGATEDHPNPLYTYDLGSPLPDGFRDRSSSEFDPEGRLPFNIPTAYFGSWKRTYRWPTHVKNNPTEQIDKLDSFLNRKSSSQGTASRGSWADLKKQVSSLFLYPENIAESDGAYVWDAFSNTGALSQPTEADWRNPGNSHYWTIARQLRGIASIEQPHNLVHLLVGGLGHMMDNDFASFDPIFFLHHCNVDRILALWEQAYPKYFMGNDGYIDKNGVKQQFKQIGGKFGWKDAPKKNPNDWREPTFSVNDLKGNTPLTPFRKADGSYWTSDDTRWGSKVPKNYTYEDIPVEKKLADPLRPTTGLFMNLSLAPSAALGDVIGDTHPPASRITPAENTRGGLQKLFGFNPVPARQHAYELLGESRKLIYPEIQKPRRADCDPIYDFRLWVMRIRVDPHMLGLSYLVNIGYRALDVTGNNILSGHIGSIAVLTRSKETQCAACQGRREEKVKSVYTIMIHHKTIAQMAVHSGEMHVVQLLQKSLSAEIALPDGTAIANTPTTLPPNAKPIPEEFTPEITLHSAALEARFDGTDHDRTKAQDHAPLTPCETYDWQFHGSLFPAQSWVAT